jgi:hypothetical protein
MGISGAPAPVTAASTQNEAAKTELRVLFTELEGFLNAGKFEQKGWSSSKEADNWFVKLNAADKKIDSDASITTAVRTAAESMRSLFSGLDFSDGKFSEVTQAHLQNVLAGIKNDPSDKIGAHTLEFAARHTGVDKVETATPEQEAQQEKERQEYIRHMTEVTAPAQKELGSLYKELLSMRGTQQFKELCFSTKNKMATDWKKRAEAFRERIMHDDNIAVQVRAAAGHMIAIGIDSVWRAGGHTQQSKYFDEEIRTAINWKWQD